VIPTNAPVLDLSRYSSHQICRGSNIYAESMIRGHLYSIQLWFQSDFN